MLRTTLSKTTPFRLLTLSLICAATLVGFSPPSASAGGASLPWAGGPAMGDAVALAPVALDRPAIATPPSEMGLTLALLHSSPFDAQAKATPDAGAGAVAFLAALHEASGLPEATTFASAALAVPVALIAPLSDEIPETQAAALEAVRPELGPLLASNETPDAPLMAEAPQETARKEEPVEPGVLTLAELESHAGGTGVNIGLLTNQILTGISSGNSINAGQVSSGGITIETDAFSGYDGIGNFMINSGHNNVLQSSVNVSIVMTPP
jgi:hypothetical protein